MNFGCAIGIRHLPLGGGYSRAGDVAPIAKSTDAMRRSAVIGAMVLLLTGAPLTVPLAKRGEPKGGGQIENFGRAIGIIPQVSGV